MKLYIHTFYILNYHIMSVCIGIQLSLGANFFIRVDIIFLSFIFIFIYFIISKEVWFKFEFNIKKEKEKQKKKEQENIPRLLPIFSQSFPPQLPRFFPSPSSLLPKQLSCECPIKTKEEISRKKGGDFLGR